MPRDALEDAGAHIIVKDHREAERVLLEAFPDRG
jgi:hypothetical protein